jgi:hypothetical protein
LTRQTHIFSSPAYGGHVGWGRDQLGPRPNRGPFFLCAPRSSQFTAQFGRKFGLAVTSRKKSFDGSRRWEATGGQCAESLRRSSRSTFLRELSLDRPLYSFLAPAGLFGFVPDFIVLSARDKFAILGAASCCSGHRCFLLNCLVNRCSHFLVRVLLRSIP